MLRKRCIFLKFVLLFLFTPPSHCCIKKAIGNNFKYAAGNPESYKAENVDLKELSDDKISVALSDLSLSELHTLNDLLTGKISIDDRYIRNSQDNWNNNYKRSVGKTKESIHSIKIKKSPEQKIHETLRQLRESIGKQVRANIVRKKRENKAKKWEQTNSNYILNSPDNEEYIKMLENSFPNNDNNQADNEGSHVRVKRN